MKKVVVDYFNNNNLILRNKTIVIAVSTGVDSMALLAIMNELKVEYSLDIHVVHVNHQIRKQSNEEEVFIEEYTKANSLGLHVLHLKKNEGVNFQSYAREERYKFFFEIVRKINADYLLLAHHGFDNVETIMMRILRGSNLKGYAGMNDIINMNGFKILRPFLNTTKTELVNYVIKKQIKYFEDYTNEEDIYTRNRIRKELIPIIFKEEENAHQKFGQFSNTLFEAAKIIDEKIETIISSYESRNNYVSFLISEFLKESNFIQEEVLFSLLKKYDLSKANILEIIKLINSNKQNIKVEFKKSFTFVKEYNKITLLYYISKPFKVDILIDEIKTYLINDTIEIIVSKSDCNFVSTNGDLWYNSNMLPVRLRSRKPGDKILLESGDKKVKDLLIDLKIGILKREKVLILEKDEEILAVIGIRKSVNLKKIKNNDILIRVREIKNG